MARRLEDQIIRDVGVPLGDGRVFRRGVVVGAGDAARSAATRARDAALDMQTGEYATTLGPDPDQAARQAYASYLTPTVEPTQVFQTGGGRRRTLSSGMSPTTGAVDYTPADFQGALATLRNAGPVEGKDYSEASLQRIARQPGGNERIILEANSVLPVVQQRRQLDQSRNYVGGLTAQAADVGKQIAELDKTIEPAPTLDLANPAVQQRVMAQAATLAEAAGSTDPQSFFDQARQTIEFNDKLAWEGRNKDALALRRQLQQNQKDIQSQVTDFAKRGIFAADGVPQNLPFRQPVAAVDPAIAALTGGGAASPAGMSALDERTAIAQEVLRTNGLREERRRRRLDQIDPSAPDAAQKLNQILAEAETAGAFTPVNNPLPAGSIGYSRPDGTYTVELADGSIRDFASANEAASTFAHENQVYADELAADAQAVALENSVNMAPAAVAGGPRRNLAMANEVTPADIAAAQAAALAVIGNDAPVAAVTPAAPADLPVDLAPVAEPNYYSLSVGQRLMRDLRPVGRAITGAIDFLSGDSAPSRRRRLAPTR